MLWCLLSIAGVAILGGVLRSLVRKITTSKFLIAHVDSFIGNLGSGVFAMELGVIGKTHGKYSLHLLFAGFVHLFLKFCYFNRLGGFQNPLSFIASYYRDGRRIRFSLFFAASIIITQFVGLYSGQLLARLVWTFADQIHIDSVPIVCTTSMSLLYPWYHIALYETLGVVIGVFVDAVTPLALKEASAAFVTMSLYFFLTHITGSFFNPIIATAFSFRCAGHTSDWEHLAVYWIGPAIGMILAWEVLAALHKRKDLNASKKME